MTGLARKEFQNGSERVGRNLFYGLNLRLCYKNKQPLGINPYIANRAIQLMMHMHTIKTAKQIIYYSIETQYNTHQLPQRFHQK